jgi:hypothetical protein
MRTLLVLTAAVLAGCSARVDRYTWTGGDSTRFELNRQECIHEANAAYVPWVAGNGPRLTLYKDCMERRGYIKTSG